MRTKLKNINGLRKEFIGIFARFGSKTNFKGYPETTVLLQDVKCTGDSKINCDHLWFMLTKEFERVKLQEGDVVKFQARVKEYVKGYRGYREDVEYEHPVEQDYKLSYPTQVRLIRRDNGEKLRGKKNGKNNRLHIL